MYCFCNPVSSAISLLSVQTEYTETSCAGQVPFGRSEAAPCHVIPKREEGRMRDPASAVSRCTKSYWALLLSTIRFSHAPRPHCRAAPALRRLVPSRHSRSSFRTGDSRRGACCPVPRSTASYIDVHQYTSSLERPHPPHRHPGPGRNRHPSLRREPLRRPSPVPRRSHPCPCGDGRLAPLLPTKA